MRKKTILKTILFLLLFNFLACGDNNQGDTPDKNDKEQEYKISYQEGSLYNDYARDIAKDSKGNIYTLSTWGLIVDDEQGLGSSNVKLNKFNKNYEKIWTKTFDSSNEDLIYMDTASKLMIDKSDNIYILGNTSGNIDGVKRELHGSDPFLIKLDYSGKEILRKQWGSKSNDYLRSAVLDDSNNIYIIGSTVSNFNTDSDSKNPNIFITKINNNSAIEWTKHYEIGIYDYYSSATIKGNNIYISVWLQSSDSSNNKDCFLLKFNEGEGFREIPIIETDKKETIFDIATNKEGDIYIVGYTEGDLSSVIPNKDGKIEEKGKTGPVDMFILKVGDNGIEDYKQWGTTGVDEATGLSIDEEGNFYIAGMTNKNSPLEDTYNSSIYLVKFDKDFNELWSKTKLINKKTFINSILLDDDRIHLLGSTLGSIEGYENQGENDIFITSFKNKE